MFNSDVLMIGLVFALLFGAISLYLYMYVQQVDQKVNLLESILLDMKVSNEIKGFVDVPASESDHAAYVPFTDSTVVEITTDKDVVEEELEPFVDKEEDESAATIPLSMGNTQSTLIAEFDEVDQPAINYETATLKELQAIAKSKGVAVGNMKKSQLVEALKGVEQSGYKSAGLTSFLETSAPVSNEP